MAFPIQAVGLKALRGKLRRLSKSDAIKASTHRALSNVWERGAAEFVKTTVQNIATETGMSAATLFPLARVVKRGSVEAVEAHIRANRSPTKPFAHDRPEFPSGKHSKELRNRSVGDRFGKKAFTLTLGKPNRQVFTFQFSIVVFQFAVHEASRNALPAGRQAFFALVKERFAKAADFAINEEFRRIGIGTRRLVPGASS